MPSQIEPDGMRLRVADVVLGGAGPTVPAGAMRDGQAHRLAGRSVTLPSGAGAR